MLLAVLIWAVSIAVLSLRPRIKYVAVVHEVLACLSCLWLQHKVHIQLYYISCIWGEGVYQLCMIICNNIILAILPTSDGFVLCDVTMQMKNMHIICICTDDPDNHLLWK